MSSATLTTTTSPEPRGPFAWVGRSVIDGLGYVGGVTILLVGALGWLIWPWKGRRDERGPGFMRSLLHQLFWMLFMGIPTIGLVHIAVGSFLSLQAYYGSTFVDGTGAVVGVGLLRNLGGIMSGMVFSGILAARMIPELRMIKQRVVLEEAEPAAESSGPGRRGRNAADPPAGAGTVVHVSLNRLTGPRIAAAAIGCILLSLWGITVGTVVGWKASESLMGLSTEMFFMMLLGKMMWFRDVDFRACS